MPNPELSTLITQFNPILRTNVDKDLATAWARQIPVIRTWEKTLSQGTFPRDVNTAIYLYLLDYFNYQNVDGGVGPTRF